MHRPLSITATTGLDMLDTSDGSHPPPSTPPARHDADQPALPFDVDPDDAVPYRLTAKAVRVVAPGTLPGLRVIQDAPAPAMPVDLDDPRDPRSARARALRRAGTPFDRIAHELGVDEIVVRGWIGDVAAGRSGPALRALQSGIDVAADGTSDPAAQLRRRFVQVRADAAVSAPDRLVSADFTRGLALTVAAAEIDTYAVLVRARDRALAHTVVAWLLRHAGARRGDLRVVLRLGDVHGADLTVHRWAEALALPVERLSRTRWHDAGTKDAVEALIRVADVDVAGRVAGWRDVLLGTPDLDTAGHDVAY
jgi:hypothetical protein